MHAYLKSKISRRIALYILLCSTVITFVLTAIQIVRDYHVDVASINTRIDQIALSDLRTLSNSVWVVDIDAAKSKLDGLVALPDIHYIHIMDESGEIIASSGKQLDHQFIYKEFPLDYRHRDKLLNLGNLYIQADLHGVYQRLIDKVIVILVSQATKTFLVSIFILLIVQYLVTRHLDKISIFVGKLDFMDKQQELVLDRKPSRWFENDELDKTVSAVNDMHDKLWYAYNEILEQKVHLEERVNERTEELNHRNEEMKSFCYSVSHDLRAPLRSIHGFSDILLEDYSSELEDSGKDYLQRVKNSAVRMGELIDDLLMLSRVSQREIKLQYLSVSGIANEIATQLDEEALVSQRHITWVIQPSIEVYADKNLIRIILENLLGNAYKYTSREAHAKIEIKYEFDKERNTNIISVSDNGVGFDMAYSDKLFLAFHRLHSGGFEGTGIGLAIVAKAISRMNGKIWANAVPGEGATFSFSLPVNTED